MKADVSVGGIWHSADIVQALEEHNMLNKYYTSRPYHKLPSSIKKIDSKKIKCYSQLDFLQAISTRVLKNDLQVFKAKSFDKLVSNNIENVDLLVVWSSFGCETIKRAKE